MFHLDSFISNVTFSQELVILDFETRNFVCGLFHDHPYLKSANPTSQNIGRCFHTPIIWVPTESLGQD